MSLALLMFSILALTRCTQAQTTLVYDEAAPSSFATPTALPPCEEQFVYQITMMQCNENPDHQGVWTVINLDPANCSGYCTTGASSPPPPPPTTLIACDIEKLESDCLSTKNGICQFEVFDAALCNVGCGCVSADPPTITCDDVLAGDKETCLRNEDKKTKCSFIISDPSTCQGQCRCERIQHAKRHRCKPLVA